MMFIDTRKGRFEFDEVHLYHGRNKLCREQCEKNLLAFKKILDSRGIHFGLIFGTLLGAIRDGSFIEHDEDVDVFVLAEQKEDFLDCLFDFKNAGLSVVRYIGKMLSLMAGNDYIDIHFFSSGWRGKRRSGGYLFDGKYFKSGCTVIFLGEVFRVPYDPEVFLQEVYGKTWRIPQINCSAEPNEEFNKVLYLAKKIILKLLPPSIVTRHIKN